VNFELFDFIDLAIKREKQIKGYSRKKKHTLIDSLNPKWIDLYSNKKIDWGILTKDSSLRSE
jgi:putative endonuclease